ncbi:hypothetical protein GCM10028791_35060 [Echinicola sediminis]
MLTHRTERKEMIPLDHFSEGPGCREGTRKGGMGSSPESDSDNHYHFVTPEKKGI